MVLPGFTSDICFCSDELLQLLRVIVKQKVPKDEVRSQDQRRGVKQEEVEDLGRNGRD
jgi:hypothetical protein